MGAYRPCCASEINRRVACALPCASLTNAHLRRKPFVCHPVQSPSEQADNTVHESSKCVMRCRVGCWRTSLIVPYGYCLRRQRRAKVTKEAIPQTAVPCLSSTLNLGLTRKSIFACLLGGKYAVRRSAISGQHAWRCIERK